MTVADPLGLQRSKMDSPSLPALKAEHVRAERSASFKLLPEYAAERFVEGPPRRVRVVCGDLMLRQNGSNSVSVEVRALTSAVKKRNVFVVCNTGAGDGSFVLRNVRSSMCVGCVQLSGLLVASIFPYTIDRARELLWRMDGKRLYNVFHEAFVGKALSPTSREHVRGMLHMEDTADKAVEFDFAPVQTFWSECPCLCAITACG